MGDLDAGQDLLEIRGERVGPGPAEDPRPDDPRLVDPEVDRQR